ncbi:MAG: pSer/pThr/pTyr-binding forkhead associated (FHA) protein, partial [Myxococcota bacterium]
MLCCPEEAAVGRVVPLGPTPLLVGRSPNGGLSLADKGISTAHLTIGIAADRRIVIEDLKSKNGTRVDRAHIVGSVAAFGDAIIRLGETVLHVGRSLPEAVEDRRVVDPLLMRLSALHSTADALLIECGSGCGTGTLAERLHRKRRAVGPLIDLASGGWDPDDPTATIARAEDGAVVLRGAELLDETQAKGWLAAAAAARTLLVFQSPGVT